MPNYYPIMLDVRGRRSLVIGGDRIAAEKATALLASGALVTIMRPAFGPEVLALHEQQKVELRQKAYERGDLQGAFVVVAATNDPQLIEAIWSEAQECGKLINIVDVPARCNFIVPSILRRDQLTIAVSTEGASPSLAKRIRQRLESLFPPAYGAYLRLAAIAREHMRGQGVSYARRDDFFGDFFNSEILSFLAEKNERAALAAAVNLLHNYHIDIAPETLAIGLKEAGESR